MANIKFSSFTTETDPANVDFLVGYEGTTMKKIDPANIGGGASDLNGLSDVTIENTNENAYFIDIPASRSGDLGNLGLGVDALDSLTTGKYNLAIGANALNTLTTSQNATAVGYNAGAAAGTNLMGDTTLIGNNAGFGRSGYRTVAVGSGAMGFGSGKTAVNRNTAIGYHALYRIDTNGADNIAIGHEASQFLTTATQNIAIGDNAARSSTADSHISIGYQAGYSQTSGINNTNLGYEAGYTATTSTDNVNIGYQAGRLNTGANNTFIGSKAGDATTTGANNIIIGANTDASSATVSNEITLGDANITSLRIPGLQSGASNGDVLTFSSATGDITLQPGGGGGGASSLNDLSDVLIDGTSSYLVQVPAGLSGNPVDNTTLGNGAGQFLTTGTQNTFIGHDAGRGCTSNSVCIFIGDEAGRNITTGSNIIGIGLQTCLSAGDYTVALGSQAARNANASGLVAIGGFAAQNATAFNHVSIGYQAGLSQTSGSGNTNVGAYAGYANTTGLYNTYVGNEAGRFSTGVYNTFMGYQAGRWRTGSSSVYIGTEAGEGSSPGNTNGNCIGIGYQAMKNATSTAGTNTAIGYRSGYVLEGSLNTFLGYQTGLAVTTGSNNTFIGNQAGDATTTGANNTIIGAGADASSATVSNEITLGNSSISALRCQVQTISALSDSRDKTNIQPSPYGLDLISQLQPVTFDWNMRDGAKVGQKDLGFIAQELQEVDDENLQLVYDSNPDKLEASYGRLIPVLVQAIKELKAEVELLKNK